MYGFHTGESDFHTGSVAILGPPTPLGDSMATPVVPLPTSACTPASTKMEAALECRLKKVIEAGPSAITERLCELEVEWTAGRAAKATAGVLIVVGLGLSLTVNLMFLIVPIIGGAVMFQYIFGRTSLIGQLFHAFGFRSGSEIDQEKMALRVLRGDFASLPTVHMIEDREAVGRMEDEGGPAVEFDEVKRDADGAVKELMGAVRN